ncbi:MAG: sulfur carrier protein ThiS [Lachnospiraceae bacterium]|nr:sulfur carrier protein ThiS [Lachnospiraceae bacterium]
MKIIVAGEKKEYEEGTTLEKLIEKEDIDNPQYVTVTINEEFVDREKFSETVLKDDDSIEFLYFMGGGQR